jgi:mono/diheme cytochrome c family protein
MTLKVLLLPMLLLFTSDIAHSSGRATFMAICAKCHGENADAKTPFGQKYNLPDFHGKHVQSQTDDELYESIGRGVNHKVYPHSFVVRGTLTAEQVREVIAFIRELRK